MQISRSLSRMTAGTALLGVCAYLVFAQGGAGAPAPAPTPPDFGALNLQTNVGSFRITGTKDPAEGRLEIQFTGSVLVSQLDPNGTVTASEGLIKEYDARDRKVYFGSGKLVVEGKFRKFQWFGRDMQARFVGKGIFLMYGEFDKNLDTGTYWYDGNPKRFPWGQGGRTLAIPNEGANVVKPVPRNQAGGGGG
jgi:hypothetical protein